MGQNVKYALYWMVKKGISFVLFNITLFLKIPLDYAII